MSTTHKHTNSKSQASDSHSATSESTPQPQKKQPGASPNSKNASRRKLRPRKTNATQQQTADMNISWADPIPEATPMPHDLNPSFDSIPAGLIDLDVDLPLTIAVPFSQSLIASTSTLQTNPEYAKQSAEKLKALCFYKAASQLFNTMNDVDKVSLLTLSDIPNDNHNIPVHMAYALSMIGDFDSKFGRIAIENAPLLFRRWVCAGLVLDPNVEHEHAQKLRALPLTSILHMVWRDLISKKLVDYLVFKLSEQLQTPYNLTIRNVQFTITSRPITENNVRDYVSTLPHEDPNFKILTRLAILAKMSIRDWIAGKRLKSFEFPENLAEFTMPTELYVNHDQATVDDHDFTDETLELIHVYDAPEECNDDDVIQHFTEAMSEYDVTYRRFIESHMDTIPMSNTGYGYPAQIATNDKRTVSSILPLADSDLNYGYMYYPNVSFEFNPNFIAHSQSLSQEKQFRFASFDDNINEH